MGLNSRVTSIRELSVWTDLYRSGTMFLHLRRVRVAKATSLFNLTSLFLIIRAVFVTWVQEAKMCFEALERPASHLKRLEKVSSASS